MKKYFFETKLYANVRPSKTHASTNAATMYMFLSTMNFLERNESFWNEYSQGDCPWSVPPTKELFDKAKNGRVEIFVTTSKLVPQSWLPTKWNGLKVLGLASGGGQQMPLVAAAGAEATLIDLSEEQLRRDEAVAKENNLQIKTVKGNMKDLSVFEDASFDLVINPVSTVFVDEIQPVWNETYRVLKPGGVLIAGLDNPVSYALDYELYEKSGKMELIYSIPYSDQNDLPKRLLDKKIAENDSFEFGHSLTQQIGGQIQAGFVINGFYEDYWGKGFNQPIDKIMPQFFATRAQKLFA